MADRSKQPLPSFSGNYMPTNITVNVDDDIGVETTRRIGGVGIMPSFQPMGFHVGPSSQMGSSFSTAPQKAAPSIAPIVSVESLPEPVKKAGWKLYDAPILPEFHPLERSAVFVPRSQPFEVAQRISGILRDRSIAATYDNIQAKARCSTLEQVDFRIRLYRGRKQYSHGIIVEVQRRFGSSITFHDDTAAILEAAQGTTPAPPDASRSGASAYPLVSDSEDDYDETDGSSLGFVSKMLNFPGYDAHHLALQTLVSLTDPIKMGARTARKVSKELLDAESDIGSKVLSLVVDFKPDHEETFGLRVQAMTVLANAIHAVHGNVSPYLRERLRPSLLNEMRKAEVNPQMAFMATKCIEPLIQGDHDASELHGALEIARSVGDARHSALRRQADICIQQIEESR